MRTAMGLMPAPETPPVVLASSGFLFSMSMTMPVKVLTREMQSAPPFSAACAFSAMLSTLGESLTMRGVLGRLFLAARVTSPMVSGRMPNAMPPHFTLGQEMLSSTKSTSPSSRAQRRSEHSPRWCCPRRWQGRAFYSSAMQDRARERRRCPDSAIPRR